MPKMPHIEQRPWWPDALRRFEQLAEAGVTTNAATAAISQEFDASDTTFRNAIERGSVPTFQPREVARAKAWAAGQERYEGRPCKKHGAQLRYTADGACVECMFEWSKPGQKLRDRITSRGAE